MCEDISLAGCVALVTGASRGIGKGIALQLGDAGATVYITGRTLAKKTGVTGSLAETAEEVESRGGRCIPVQCDHTNSEDISRLFDLIATQQHGRLDLLVNNAFSAINCCVDSMEKNFWDMKAELWDDINDVGLRNHYLCCVYASRLMVPRRQGLIVNMSSSGALTYMFTVAYGVGKVAFDRLAVDCAHELKPHNVAAVSLWPGPIRTENLMDTLNDNTRSENSKWVLNIVKEKGATPQFVGQCVVRLCADKNIMKKSGKVLLAPDLASEYGFCDVDGSVPANMRSVRQWLARGRWSALAYFVPDCIKFPGWVISMFCSHM